MFHTVAGRQVHSVSFGDGPRTLVAIPGSIANWEIWQQTFEILSRRWRVVGIDHAGVGETKVQPGEITFALQVELVSGVLDAYGIDRCVLAGDSNNVAVAVELARRDRDRFAGLVLAAGVPWGFDGPEVRRFVKALRSDFTGTVRFFAELCLPEQDSAHLRQWLHDMITRTGLEATIALLESYYPVDLRDRLGEITQPTLVIHGALDATRTAAAEQAEQLARAVPGARLEVIDGTGHVPMLSRPDRVAASIDGFMAGLEP